MANRIVMVDPNPEDMGLVPLEDLCIIVDLQTSQKSRSNISTNENSAIINQTTGSDFTVNFISGTEQDGVRNLTTNYTNIGGYKTPKTVFNNNSDLEGLGITNININFNSSYAPQIVIDMIDIRGSSILEYGNLSKYNVFFNLPYPIFKLTIKGYYGKSVTYCLHLMKWNASFNSETGNFEIKCEFVGHTYAFLTDMLVGYLKAAVETTKGKSLLEEKKLNDPNLMSITEMIGKINKMNLELVKLKQSNESIKELAIVKNKLDEFQEIGQSFITFKINHTTYDSNNGTSILASTNDGITVFDNSKPNSLKIDVNNLEDVLTSKVTDTNKSTDVDNYTLTLDYYKKNLYTIYDGTIGNFKIDNVLPYTLGVESYEYIKNQLNNISNDRKIIITDWRNAYSELEVKKLKLKNTEKTLTNTVGDIISDSIDSEVGFNPSIKNIINIFATHVDIFMDLIRGVAIECENNPSGRHKKFENSLEYLDIKNETSGNVSGGMPGIIYPFPGYDENGVETWIGNKINNIPETNFIEELLIGFLTTAKKESESDSILENGSSGWYPASILETKLLGGENIYDVIKDEAKEYIILDEFYKRLFLFFGCTNSNLSNDEIINMAIIEANNIHKYPTNQFVKDIIKVKTPSDLLKDMLTNEKYQKKYLYQESSDLYNFGYGLTLKNAKAGRFIKDKKLDDDETYTYIKLFTETEYTSTNESVYPSYEIPKYTKSENIINQNNYSSSFDALAGAYKSQEFFKYTYDGAESNYDVDLIFWSSLQQGLGDDLSVISNSFNNINELGGNNCDEVLKYKSDNSKILDKHYISFNASSESYSLFGSDFYFRQMDNVYNNTDFSVGKKIANRAKAILFLHTLPFDGLTGPESYGLFSPVNDGNDWVIGYKDISVNLNAFGGWYNKGDWKRDLFNKRGGFVKVPKAWLLLIGGLLWRKKQTVDPILYNKNNYTFFIDEITQPTVNEYLKNIITLNTYLGDNEPERFGTGDYVKIEDIFDNLPKQVINTLINYFIDWTDGETDINDWNTIRKRYELENTDDINSIVEYNNLITNRNITWREASLLIDSNGWSDSKQIKNLLKTKSFINKENLNIFDKVYISPTIFDYNEDKDFTTLKANYGIEYINTKDDTTNGIANMINTIVEPIIVANTTWRIWVDTNDIKPYNYTWNYSVSTKDITTYLTEFNKTLVALETKKTSTDADKQKLFGSIDNDTIKLNLYRTIKAIYDKWIAGTNLVNSGICNCSNNQSQTLISSFRFLDKAFRDIGDKFLINPLTIRDMIKNNTNQSFYDLISQILVGNNMDFIPLPNYINYHDENEIKKVFSTYSYNEAVLDENVGPTFICMYVGQTSKQLDIIGGDYKNDSIQFNVNDNTNLPDAFKDEDGDTIPVFAVNYAQGNQSVFKNITLDQSEFSETDESLQIIEEISLQGDKQTRTPVGQNLFNVYSTRSYQIEIEMLGNAMIQPMMYFQLNNIPMFRGGYLINRTSHSIKPNYMTTKFKGVRVNRIMTPLLDRSMLYMNLIGSLSDIDISTAKLNQKIDEDYIKNGEIDTDTKNKIYNNGTGFGDPIDGKINITSVFGATSGRKNPHSGIDIGGVQNKTIVKSLYDGYIKTIKIDSDGYGLYTIVDFNEINGLKYSGEYGHLANLSETILNNIEFKAQLGILNTTNLTTIQDLAKNDYAINKLSGGVSPKIIIKKGDIIGLMGGEKNKPESSILRSDNSRVSLIGSSTGTHLHLTIKDLSDNTVKNPELIIKSGIENNLLYNGKIHNTKETTNVKSSDVDNPPIASSEAGTLEHLGKTINNPLSLTSTKDQWTGLISSEEKFAEFSDIYYGLRAGMINIGNKRSGDFKTYKGFINTYVTTQDGNDLVLYTSVIENGLGVNINDNIDYGVDNFSEFIKLIALQESGSNLNINYIKKVINLEYNEIFKPKYA
jgi:hypothetical protein